MNKCRSQFDETKSFDIEPVDTEKNVSVTRKGDQFSPQGALSRKNPKWNYKHE